MRYLALKEKKDIYKTPNFIRVYAYDYYKYRHGIGI